MKHSTTESTSLGFLPTFGEFILLLPALVVLMHPAGLSVLLNDGDTGWHIRTGEWILTHHAVPFEDPFSFTRIGKQWFAWEWGWDVAAARIHDAWGLSGVALVALLTVCLSYYLLYRHCAVKCGNPLISAGVVAVAIFSAWSHWLARPHVVTLLLLVATMWWIDRHARSGRRKLLLLVPITGIWANIHGGFVMMLVVMGTYTLGEFLGLTLGGDAAQRRKTAVAFGTFGGIAILCALASLANPWGWRLHEHIVSYLQDSAIRERTVEFRAPNVMEPRILLLLLMDFATVVWCVRKKQITECMLVLGTGWMALSSSRHVSVHGVIAAPIISEALAGWAGLGAIRCKQPMIRGMMEDLEASGREWASVKRRWISFLMPGLLAAGMILGATFHISPRLRGDFRNGKFPVEAVRSIPREDSGLRVFNDDGAGYVIYELWPRATLFCDGRMDFYGPEMIADYDQLLEVKSGWRNKFEKYALNVAILRVNTPLARALEGATGWRKAYQDQWFAVFRLKQPAQMPVGGQSRCGKILPANDVKAGTAPGPAVQHRGGARSTKDWGD